MAETAKDDAARKFRDSLRRLQEAETEEHERKRRQVMATKPIVKPADVLVVDPQTGDRLTFETVTHHQYMRIKYKPVTLGDKMDVPESEDPDKPSTWSGATKARFLARNLVEPDLVGAARDAGAEFNAQWLERHVEWPVVDDLVNTIFIDSQPSRRVPHLRLEEEGQDDQAPFGRDGSPTRSTSPTSTTSDTDASDQARSTA